MIHWSKQPQTPQLDIIAFGAHPDDAELMAAGTLTLMSQKFKTAVIDITEAELSTNGSIDQRKAECALATDIMGIHARGNLKRKDGYLYKDQDLTELLTSVLRQCQPKVIIGPPENCRHPDHQSLHKSLKQALFFSGLKKFLPEYPAIIRPRLFHYLEVQDQKPDFCIDISDVWEEKKQAILAYQSQFTKHKQQAETFINSGFIEKLEQRFKSYGQAQQVEYAEPFLSEEPVIFSDPQHAFF